VNRVILPGATIGVLGSGQLGRMFAIAARRMGYRVHTFSPDYDTPTGQVADKETQAAYDDLDAVRDFARQVDVITFEFENIPTAAVEAAAGLAPVRPDGAVLYTIQNRLREKMFLASAGFPVAPFRAVRSLAELNEALVELGSPAVLKTAGWGYDGKGQSKIMSLADAPAAWQAVASNEAVVEKFVDFECEVSVVAARSLAGDPAEYDTIFNTHVNHILDVSCAPAPIPPKVAREAVAMARAVLETLEVVGVLCVEFFLLQDDSKAAQTLGTLIVNEMAPRPHNSGHYTLDACDLSQFDLQVRTLAGLPLVQPRQHSPAIMLNLLGDLWLNGASPPWDQVLALPGAHLHLYGKLKASKGRKMGHLTFTGATVAEVRATALAAARLLGIEAF